ncbi:ubiquitin-like protein FUBI [Anneissia japonica]|uniref:ubiquitin-like protein FUBI n=1 Tax=Anneissia japonica TaxID=1529436 RepID=UPI0014254E67|nr:ubiquitin-like protein FUBI [Anneissia japonica]XP_033110586.1 ubiquitin-like protein FUBI [Anneissia japonica]
MQLIVSAQRSHLVNIGDTVTVHDVKLQIERLEGIVADEQVIFHAGSPLDNSVILAKTDILELSTLDVQARLLGGKVHGSLARAGKVKGQTPKVDKQEKKKKKTGRAKRRMLYNRRFVNVVQTFGKRKGPNSNS